MVDTNAFEPLRANADEAVLRWLAGQDDMATTAITVAELLTGARQLSTGRRRKDLLAAIERALHGLPDSELTSVR